VIQRTHAWGNQDGKLRWCTSAAIEVGRATRAEIPAGVGKVSAYGAPAGMKQATPYHLNQELKAKGLLPTQVNGEYFKGVLDIVPPPPRTPAR
jgi:hypothetical protein